MFGTIYTYTGGTEITETRVPITVAETMIANAIAANSVVDTIRPCEANDKVLLLCVV